jgi:multicomponent Na+:H+ antiporter subunit F
MHVVVDWSLDPLNWVFAMLIAAMFLTLVRIAKGPSLPDRVVAVDLLVALKVGFTATYSVAAAQPVLLDVAIVLALVAFLGTVAFARFLERRRQGE